MMESSHKITRRCFVRGAAGLALSSAVLPGCKRDTSSTPSEKWVFACRDNLLKWTNKPDSFSAMKALGVTGAEVQVDLDLTCPTLYAPNKAYSLATASGIQALKEDLDENGLVITSFLMHNRLDERLDEELAWMSKLVKAAQKLGVKVIRIDVVPRRIKEREDFVPFIVKACKQLCDIIEGTAIRYGIENHGSTTNDPVFLEQLFDGVGSSHLGLTLDTANFYWYGHPLDKLYAIFERFASKAFHTHCKSIRYPEDKKNVQRPRGWEYGKYCCPIYEGDIDFQKVVGILRRAGYQGDLCIEDESLSKFPEDERADVVKKEVALLRSLT
jgi:sugar phosphate isomerase/epimerase